MKQLIIVFLISIGSPLVAEDLDICKRNGNQYENPNCTLLIHSFNRFNSTGQDLMNKIAEISQNVSAIVESIDGNRPIPKKLTLADWEVLINLKGMMDQYFYQFKLMLSKINREEISKLPLEKQYMLDDQYINIDRQYYTNNISLAMLFNTMYENLFFLSQVALDQKRNLQIAEQKLIELETALDQQNNSLFGTLNSIFGFLSQFF